MYLLRLYGFIIACLFAISTLVPRKNADCGRIDNIAKQGLRLPLHISEIIHQPEYITTSSHPLT